jgi:transcriptional regulator with XRE-family HTH domain
MDQSGSKLRAVRQRWGLSLREVEERSAQLAQLWKRPACKISASWLDRIEQGAAGISLAKFIALAAIYSIPADALLSHCPLGSEETASGGVLDIPNKTLLLTGGPIEEHARAWLPENAALQTVPENTSLLDKAGHLPSHYRHAVIGKRDKTMSPMIHPGSIVLINTQKRAIGRRQEWTSEFDRPLYFLFTRHGYACCWCELDKDSKWLTLVSHPLSHTPEQRLLYRKEVEVIGRIAVILLRLDPSEIPK